MGLFSCIHDDITGLPNIDDILARAGATTEIPKGNFIFLIF